MELNLNTYNVRDIVLKTVPTGKNNAGQHYVTMTLRNAGQWAEAAFTQNFFDEDLYNELKQFVNVSKGGIVPDGQPCPELPVEYKQLRNGVFMQYKFQGGSLVRKDMNTGAAVLVNGIPQTNDSCTVFCIATTLLPDGTISWARGKDPDTLGRSIERHMYFPPQQTQAEKPVVTEAPTTSAAPQALTPEQQAMLAQLQDNNVQNPIQQ